MRLSPVDKFYKNLPIYKEELEKLLDPNVVRRGRKRKNKMYFTPITEKAIVAYNKEAADKSTILIKEFINDTLIK